MKRFLLLLPLVITPAAQAVDYVQCEAMRKTFTRLEDQKHQAVQEAKRTVCVLTAEVPIKKWLSCLEGQPTDLHPNPAKWPREVQWGYDKKLMRVALDMQKARCDLD